MLASAGSGRENQSRYSRPRRTTDPPAPPSTIAEYIRNQREAAPAPRPQRRGIRHGN
jgi:hypothetical protein